MVQRQEVSSTHRPSGRKHTRRVFRPRYRAALLLIGLLAVPASLMLRQSVLNRGARQAAASTIAHMASHGLPRTEEERSFSALAHLEQASWGPLPKAWVIDQRPATTRIVSAAEHDWMANAREHLISAGKRWVEIASPFRQDVRDHVSQEIKALKNPAAMIRETSRWTKEASEWQGDESLLAKQGGGLSKGRPRWVTNELFSLEKALTNPHRNPNGVATANKAVIVARQYLNEPPQEELQQYRSVKRALTKAVQGLTPIPVPASPPATETKTPSGPVTFGTLTGAIQQYLATRTTTASVAVLNLDNGALWTFRPDVHYDTASIIKATIMGTLLWQAEEKHRPLSSLEVNQMVPMIEESSNSAATTLWNLAGRSQGIGAFLRASGMNDTIPGKGGYWGLTQTTVGDQVKLIKLLATPNNLLNAQSRAYATNLMTHVAGFEDWGVSSHAPSGSTVALKNGWLPVPGIGWEINSVGWVQSTSGDIALAILSNHNPSEAYGIQSVQHLAGLVEQAEENG